MLFIYLFACLFFLFVCLFACLSVYLFIYLFIYLFTYLFFYLSTYLLLGMGGIIIVLEWSIKVLQNGAYSTTLKRGKVYYKVEQKLFQNWTV